METILKSNISKLATKTQLFLEVKKHAAKNKITKDQAYKIFNLRDELTDLSGLTSRQWYEFKGDFKNAEKITPSNGNRTTITEVLNLQQKALMELKAFLNLKFDDEFINPHSISLQP